ncbi:MAG: single-stranded DNA-binding protein, partial [Clostridia bacterium]|nr:single-stranded DNA-binding protein [Clostridia bacterium]
MQTLENAVGIAGNLKELNRVTTFSGVPFDGYVGKVTTPRTSGIMDEVIIAFMPDAMDVDSIQELTVPYDTMGITFTAAMENNRVLAFGKMQTLKDFATGHVTVFALADYIAVTPRAELQNETLFTGTLASDPIYRETPRGREITDLMVNLPSELAAQPCRVPAICWGNNAKRAINWRTGDTVRITGRCQSREYLKVIDTTVRGKNSYT